MGPSGHLAPGPAPSSPTPYNCNRVTQLALDHRQEENKLEEVQDLPGPSSRALPLQVNTGATEAAFTRADSYPPMNSTSNYCKSLRLLFFFFFFNLPGQEGAGVEENRH